MRKLFILNALNAVFLSSCDNNKSASANEPIVDSITHILITFLLLVHYIVILVMILNSVNGNGLM